MPTRLYLASGNTGKIRELSALAAEAGVAFEALPNYSALPAASEEATSFALNALEKALHYSRLIHSAEPFRVSLQGEPPGLSRAKSRGSRLGEPQPLVVADDSGLVVDALGGAPGPRSARYAQTGRTAGPNATDAENNRALLAALADVADERRTARYVCVLVLAQRGQVLALFSDHCEGRILRAPRGTGGFGYDPLFFFPPLNRTMAELSLTEKNQHSHRARAFRKLLAFLSQTPTGN